MWCESEMHFWFSRGNFGIIKGLLLDMGWNKKFPNFCSKLEPILICMHDSGLPESREEIVIERTYCKGTSNTPYLI